VLISRPELITFAVMEVNVCELSLYGMTTLATIVGMMQVCMKKLLPMFLDLVHQR